MSYDPGRDVCDECASAGVRITAVTEGKRICINCRNKWLIAETDSFAIADRLTEAEREIIMALSDKPQRIGLRSRVPIVDECEFRLFDKVWRTDCYRHFLTPFGMEVKDALSRLASDTQQVRG